MDEKAFTISNEQEAPMTNEQLTNDIGQDQMASDLVSNVDETVDIGTREDMATFEKPGSSLKSTDIEKSNLFDKPGVAERNNSAVMSDVQGIVQEILEKVEGNVIKPSENNQYEGSQRYPTVLSDVQGIVQEILEKVYENVIKPSENNQYEGPQRSMNCIDSDQDKHGEKRSYSNVVEDDLQNDTPILDAAKDSLYIMSLVKAELNTVSQKVEVYNNKKDRPRLVEYDDDDDDDNSSESSDDESSATESSDLDSTSSDDSFTKDRNEIEKMEMEMEDKISIIDPPKTKDELLFKDLPPEPEVHILLPDDAKLVHIGSVMSVVELMVVVKSLPDTPALDVDTLLFLENRKCLGKVFETFGPVKSPFYSVRFNTPEDITKMDVKQGVPVFFAPEDLDFTKLIFVSRLEKLKGSDASWKHDQEPPAELIEYSDDEEEAKAKAAKKQERKSNKPPSKGQTSIIKNRDCGENPVPSPKKPPQQKEFTRQWQGRGRGKPHLKYKQQQLPPRLPPPVHQAPTPPFGGIPPPPFFPPPGGMMPPPPPYYSPYSIPPPPHMYHVPPPQWNSGPPGPAPPPVFPSSENQPPTLK